MNERIQWPPLRRWVEYLAAILIGNAIYFLSLSPHLPPALRHRWFAPLDWGVFVDFAVCVAVYGLIRIAARVSRRRGSTPENE